MYKTELDNRDLGQRLREQAMISSNSDQMDDRQSLYVNLLEVRVKESDESIEEQGITHMFIDCMDASKRRRNIQESKDTYRIGVRRRLPSKGLKKKRIEVYNKNQSIDE